MIADGIELLLSLSGQVEIEYEMTMGQTNRAQPFTNEAHRRKNVTH